MLHRLPGKNVERIVRFFSPMAKLHGTVRYASQEAKALIRSSRWLIRLDFN